MRYMIVLACLCALLSPLASDTARSDTAKSAFFSGKNLTGAGKQASPVDLIMKPVGSAGADDPLNQRGTIAWKVSEDTSVLNSAWIRDCEHANDFSLD